MLWYDPEGRHPLTAFVLFRDTIVSAETTTRKLLHRPGHLRLIRKTNVILADGSTRHWNYSHVDDIEGDPPLGQEIVVWRHSRMYPDDDRLSEANEWDTRLKDMCEAVVEDDRALIRKLQSAYYESGGQMMGILRTEYRLVPEIESTFNVTVPNEAYLPLRTVGELRTKIDELLGGTPHSDTWKALHAIFVNQLGALPDEVTPETRLRFHIPSGSLTAHLEDSR